MDGTYRKTTWDELAKENTKLKVEIERLESDRDGARSALDDCSRHVTRALRREWKGSSDFYELNVADVPMGVAQLAEEIKRLQTDGEIPVDQLSICELLGELFQGAIGRRNQAAADGESSVD